MTTPSLSGPSVYVSVPPGSYVWAFEVAKELNKRGSPVFLDEPAGMFDEGVLQGTDARRGARHIASAICYADELLALLPKPLNNPPTDATVFPRRDFLVIALAVARIRSINTAVFLHPGLTREFVTQCESVPPFLVDGRFYQDSHWSEYYHGIRTSASTRRNERDFIRLHEGLRICLCWIDDQPKANARGKKFEEKLRAYGLDPKLFVWSRDRTAWTLNITPNEDYDALAVCARGDEPGIWDDPTFRKLCERIAGEGRPVVFVRREASNSPVPALFAGRPLIECFKGAPDSQMLALARVLIGFKDWRKVQVGSAAPELPSKAGSKQDGAPDTQKPAAPSSSIPPSAVPSPAASGGAISPALADLPNAVFCRVVGIKDMAADRAADAADVLDTAVRKCFAGKSSHDWAGPNGRFVLVNTIKHSLDACRQLHSMCAAKGVQLAIGVANGRVEGTTDINKKLGWAGPALNLAARLAQVKGGEGRTALDELARGDAHSGIEEMRGELSSLEPGQVKSTKFKFSWFGSRVAAASTSPEELRARQSETAHIVVYDMERYSQQPRAALKPLANKLNEAARRALLAAGGEKWIDGINGWYVPGGDGGAVVFRAKEGTALAAWGFVTSLLQKTRVHREFTIRIGLASGQVVDRGPEAPPVGRGMDLADAMSGAAMKCCPCVSSRFWDTLEESEQHGWTTESVSGLEEAAFRLSEQRS